MTREVSGTGVAAGAAAATGAGAEMAATGDAATSAGLADTAVVAGVVVAVLELSEPPPQLAKTDAINTIEILFFTHTPELSYASFNASFRLLSNARKLSFAHDS